MERKREKEGAEYHSQLDTLKCLFLSLSLSLILPSNPHLNCLIGERKIDNIARPFSIALLHQ